jgi:hypothetical protein
MRGAALRDAAAAAVAAGAGVALLVSVQRRRSGVRGEHERRASRAARVAAMTGDDDGAGGSADGLGPEVGSATGAEFPPLLDLAAPALGAAGLLGAAVGAGGPAVLALVRLLAGAAFLGCVTDAMLLGHWYLLQPGLARQPLNELVRLLIWTWPLEVAALLWPTGMVSVLNGHIDDGWHGLLGWIWIACAASTVVLAVVVRLALRERYYSAVMSATGLLYLAILTAFGTDLVARAVLSR